ncbi:MAG TPA: FAD-binding oxidoreductase [Dehalococcoidales bacterium]|nr:FAD-binding oxidoreductase [Dehalococcoidales bacterium]
MALEKKLAGIVGAANVITKESALDQYSRDMSFVNQVKPDCAVKPANADQIFKIVNLAKETKTPLVPVSSGAPHFRGDTVPGIGGAVVVDMSGMKKIIKITRHNRVAMVEPGVTFGELIPALAKEGLRMNMPLLPRATKTIVGSMLEREPVLMPKYQWDISDPICCVEVVFGCGETFRTGQAAGPGTIEEQWKAGGVQKTPYGPGPAQWHRLIQGSQGTMGIVTWASLRCELIPELEEPFVAGSDDLARLTELTHWLIRMRMVNECFIVNNTNLAAIMGVKKEGLPQWILFYTVAGYHYSPEERVRTQLGAITDVCKKASVDPKKAVGKISAEAILKTVQQPSPEPYWKLSAKGACQDIFFITIYDKLESQIAVMRKTAGEMGFAESEIGIYLQPIVQGINLHCEFNIFYNPGDKNEAKKVKALLEKVTPALMADGAFFSRPYDTVAREIMNSNASQVYALKKVKSVLDPNNIMNPGKLCF